MAALLMRKMKICALAILTVMLDENVNENTSRRFWVRKIFQERKRYGPHHILTNELRLFDKEYRRNVRLKTLSDNKIKRNT